MLEQVSAKVWKKNWVVHCQHAGYGQKVLEYLGRYVFRIAISNSRLEKIDNAEVTFRYRDNRSQQLRRVKLTGEEFIRRFLQHVLPRGCAKVRYYGICSPTCRKQLQQARTLLSTSTTTNAVDSAPDTPPTEQALQSAPARCPLCGIGQLLLVQVLPPQRKVPP